MRMFRKDEGFTLVELMVVVLIIGILVAIAIPIFNNASESARVKSCQSNIRTIEGAVPQYLAANPTLTAADCDGEVTTGNPLVGTSAYIKEAPVCTTDGGGTYTLDGTGSVISDQGTGGTAFLTGHGL